MIVALVTAVVVLGAPLPGRGPKLFLGRDPWRTFRFQARRTVMSRAGGRCEGALFFAWGRCGQPAVEANHVYPWSRGGPTVVANGQALCRDHNRRKSNLRPPWWYVQALERRRQGYFDESDQVRVLARYSAEDRAVRDAWRARRDDGRRR